MKTAILKLIHPTLTCYDCLTKTVLKNDGKKSLCNVTAGGVKRN